MDFETFTAINQVGSLYEIFTLFGEEVNAGIQFHTPIDVG